MSTTDLPPEFHVTHAVRIAAGAPQLGESLRRRLPHRNVRPTRMELASIGLDRSIALVLIDEKQNQREVEIHPSLDYAMGQAEFEFGIAPQLWKPAA